MIKQIISPSQPATAENPQTFISRYNTGTNDQCPITVTSMVKCVSPAPRSAPTMATITASISTYNDASRIIDFAMGMASVKTASDISGLKTITNASGINRNIARITTE